MNLNVKIFSEFNSKTSAIWKSLERRCNHYVFQTYDWNNLWYKTIVQNKLVMRPMITCVKNNQSHIALFPFGLFEIYNIKILKFMGGDQNDYNLPLICSDFSSKKYLKIIWDKILEEVPTHDIQHFFNIPEIVCKNRNPIINIWNCNLSSFLSHQSKLPSSYKIFEDRISKSVIKDTRRQIRRLNKLGKLEFRVASDSHDFRRYIDEMIKQKRRRYNETGSKDHLSNHMVRQFYKESEQLKNMNVQMTSLILNDKILATHWGVVYKKRFYFLLPTYRGGEWMKYSCGRILQVYLIKWAIESRLEIFDFTIGDEAYKSIWCDQSIKIYQREKLIRWKGTPYYLWFKIYSYLKNNRYSRSIIMKINSKLKNDYSINFS